MSAASCATSVPLTPIATPTSATASAGASLTPSPTIATPPERPPPFSDSICSAFCSGQHFGFHLVDAEFAGDVHRDAAIVAGEHDDLFDAEIAQISDGVLGGGAHGVGHANRAADLAVVRDDDGRVAFAVMFVHVLVDGLGQMDVLFAHQSFLADD